VLFLELLTNRFLQGFIVSDLTNYSGNSAAEMLFKFGECRFRIFDRIMKYRRQYQVFVRNLAFFRKDTGRCDEVVDIGGSVCVLATMVFVFLRSKGNRSEQSDMLVHFTVSPSGYWTGIIPFSTLYQEAP
jgi:hypothetical protein